MNKVKLYNPPGVNNLYASSAKSILEFLRLYPVPGGIMKLN